MATFPDAVSIVSIVVAPALHLLLSSVGRVLKVRATRFVAHSLPGIPLEHLLTFVFRV